jgi:hypothetical protein
VTQETLSRKKEVMYQKMDDLFAFILLGPLQSTSNCVTYLTINTVKPTEEIPHNLKIDIRTKKKFGLTYFLHTFMETVATLGVVNIAKAALIL